VIGKVHRLGLSNRAGSGGNAAKAAPKEKPAPKAKAPAKPKAVPATKAAPASSKKAEPEVQELDENGIPISAARRAIIPAGQPLPPQPSANEISPEALAKVSEVEKSAKRISLMELTEKTCKWPVGDPATDDFWFCGLNVQQGKPYCEAHVGVAFQPMSSRRDRRR
jgi:GcrA cell cycle regulator